ncbi:hypothetical protein [Citrobacter koseri]|uniref:hypothetical protein n=1 Tax=Citrobacter koseri TaxID=545 RepID=UPI0023AFFC93|nr:hypothetical protein [Citrobacter koseri]
MILSVFLSITFIGFWKPIVRGYPDIIAMIPLLLAFIAANKNPASQSINIKNALFIGCMLWLPFLFRRWYAYTIVSFYVVVPLIDIVWSNNKSYFKAAYYTCINYLIAGVTSICLVLLFQKELAVNVFNTDYANIYSAYSLPFLDSLNKTLYHYGLLFIAISILCITLSSVFIKESRKLLASTTLMLIVSYILFTKTQAPGYQHEIPFATWLIIPVIIAFNQKLKAIKDKNIKALLCIIVILISSTYTITSLIRSSLSSNLHASIFPQKVYPLTLNNYDNYLDMVDYLIKLTVTKERKSFSVISSGYALNQDLIKYMAKGRLDRAFQVTPDVDLRDGMPARSLLSDYLVVTTPPDIHLPQGQNVIKTTAENILSGKGIGSHYSEIARFTLSSNHTGIIFEKKTAFNKNDIDQYISQFTHIYPEWENKYNTNSFVSFLTTWVKLGDGVAWLSKSHNDSIVTHPGNNSDTYISFIPLRKTVKIELINNTCLKADGVNIYINNDLIHIEQNKTTSINIKETEQRLFLRINKNKNDICDAIRIY